MKLSDPKLLRAFLDRHELKANKGLGQHFLCSGSVVGAIVDRVRGCQGVFEIGPGPGLLTGPLAEACPHVLALELDERMARPLADSAPGVEVVFGDALQADFKSLLTRLPEPRAVASNLPYYITAPLLGKIAEVRDCFDVAVLMMQREVGDKVRAKPGDRNRGSLSVFLQACFEIELVAKVPPGAFLPPPKVESIVLAFRPKSADYGKALEKLVRFGFAQPRKTLANNLANGLHRDRSEILQALALAGLDETIRAHMLAEDEWRKLAQALE